MNKVYLIGNLTRDPEIANTQNGNTLCKFTLAVSRRFKKEEADFVNVITWNKTAEICNQYLNKGSKVAVSGSIQTGSYEKDGQKRYTFDIVADEVEFLNTRQDTAQTEPEHRQASITDMKPVDENLPF